MAPGTSPLGWLIAAAVCAALVVAGCGGGSSSSATTAAGSTDSQATKTNESGNADDSSETPEGEKAQGGGKKAEEGSGDKSGKKNPPIELPEGRPEKGPSKAQEDKVPTAEISLSIPNGLTADNTCKGKNLSPEISWENVPPGTVELAVFAVNVQPVEGKLHFDGAVAGIDPSVTRLKEGEVPDGAVLGRTSSGENGWSLCPQKSGSESYVFSVYALNKSLSPSEGFDPLDFRTRATPISNEVGLEGVNFAG